MGVTGGFAVMAGMSMVNAQSQASSAKSQAEFSAAQFSANKKFADISAGDAITRGEKNAQLERQKTRQQIGAQRAAAGASGVDVNYGSAADVQADTAGQGAMNELTIRNNAWREAWGYKTQAISAGASAGMAELGGDNQARNTLITGGVNALSYGTKAYGNYDANNGSARAPVY